MKESDCSQFGGYKNMKSELAYTIAGHRMVIETSEPERTHKLLPSFSAFLSNGNEEGDSWLYRFSGSTMKKLSMTIPVEQFNRYPYRYAVFEETCGKLIRMSLGERHHHLLIPADMRHFHSDLSLADEGESPFLDSFLMIAFTLASAPLKTVKLHASVIEKEGSALLFLGKSGTGKSTHSRLWQQYVPGCSLLNDDEPVVRINKTDEVTVYGTPWSGKTPCYRNENARVAAFVLLAQSSENNLTKLSAKEAFFALFSSCSMLRSDVHYKNSVFDTVAAILERVAVYRLDCRPDREAVSLTETLLFS